MKYALKYFSTSKILDKVDEIKIKYKEFNPALLNFVQEHINQRVIVDYKYTGSANEQNMELFAEAIKINPNFAVIIHIESEYVFELLQQYNIPYFFDEVATNLDMLNFIVGLKPTDIYIGEEICFNLKEVSSYCHNKNISIRVYPNVVETNWYNYSNGIKDFFIRPDDLEAYEPYIDIFEFYGPLDKQDILYEIYRDGRWQGLLNDLILGFKEEEEINCMNLMPDFGYYRTNCRHRCMIDKCNYCDISKELAKELKNKDIYITKGKNKYEYSANETLVQDESSESLELPV